MLDNLFSQEDEFCPLVSRVERLGESLLWESWDHWANGDVTPFYVRYTRVSFKLFPMFAPLEETALEDFYF